MQIKLQEDLGTFEADIKAVLEKWSIPGKAMDIVFTDGANGAVWVNLEIGFEIKLED